MSEKAETTLEEDLSALESESAPIEPGETPEIETAEQVASPELDPNAPETTGEPSAPEKIESTESRDKRIAGYYTERARAAQLETELAELKQTQAKQPDTPAPNYDDFDTDAEYYAATAKYEAGQAIEAFKIEQAQGQVNDSRVNAQQGFAKKVAAANIPGYDEKANLLAESVGMRPDTIEALYSLKGDIGPKIVAYLADNLDVADGISPVELGQLSEKLSATKPVQQTKAPPVVTPVKGKSAIGKSLDDPDAEFSMDEVKDIVGKMED